MFFLVADCFGSRFGISKGKSKAFKEIKHYLQIGYLPHEIFVLAPSVKNAKSPRIHTFIATSPIHMKYKLKKPEQEVLDAIKHTVTHARNLCTP